MMLRSYALVLMALTLSGCTPPQVRYHTLLSSAPVMTAPHAAPYLIDMAPVGVPQSLDLQQIVVRQGESSMARLENDRWLSPLDEELRSALSAGITARLNTQDVAGLPGGENQPVVRIAVQIRRFDTWPGQRLTLEADWRLATKARGERVSLVCKSVLTAKPPADSQQLFLRWQTLVAQLAGEIADTQSAWANAGYPSSAACRQAAAAP